MDRGWVLNGLDSALVAMSMPRRNNSNSDFFWVARTKKGPADPDLVPRSPFFRNFVLADGVVFHHVLHLWRAAAAGSSLPMRSGRGRRGTSQRGAVRGRSLVGRSQ